MNLSRFDRQTPRPQLVVNATTFSQTPASKVSRSSGRGFADHPTKGLD